MRRAFTVSRWRAWTLAIGSMVGAVLGLTMAGLSIDLSGSIGGLVMLAAVLTGSVVRQHLSEDLFPRVLDFFEMLTTFLMISTAGVILTYAVAGLSGEYVDDLLARTDQAMGFDWKLLYDFMDSHRELMVASERAYFAIFSIPIVLALAHAWTSERDRYNRFLSAYLIALAITAFLFIFFPAKSAVPYYIGLEPSYPAVVVDQHVIAIDAIKAGDLKILKLDEALGLVAFPSFHAAAAILFMWAGWPFRVLRIPLFVLNAAMMFTAFVEGSHYLTDILGGVLVAIVSIIAVLVPEMRRNAAVSILRPLRVRS